MGEKKWKIKKLEPYLRKKLKDKITKEDIETYLYLIDSVAREKDEDLNRSLFKELVSKYSGMVRDIEEKMIEIEKLSTLDHLTQVYNKRKFSVEFEREVQRSIRTNSNFIFGILDIDFFKKVNDNYGHDVGDIVLKEFANIINGSLRGTDIFARWGGEEFVVMLIDTDTHFGKIVLERLRKRIETNEFTTVGNITCSIGYVDFKSVPKNEILKKADDALYYSKRNGRNRITKWSEELEKE